MTNMITGRWRPGVAAIAGFLLGLAILTALTISLVYGGEKGRPPGAPPDSLLPGTPSLPRGDATPVAGTNAGAVVIDRFRILPPGSVPSDQPWAYLPALDRPNLGIDFRDEAQLNTATERGLQIVRPPSPQGFTLAGGGASAVALKGGDWLVWQEGYRFTSPTNYDLEVSVRRMLDGGVRELVAFVPEAGWEYVTMKRRGVTVLVLGGTADSKVQPISEAWFVLNGYYVLVDAVALAPDALLSFVDAWIDTHGTVYTARSERARAAGE